MIDVYSHVTMPYTINTGILVMAQGAWPSINSN